MSEYHIHTPSRLHFGLLAWGEASVRQFGSIGLMIEAPGLAMSARPAQDWSVTGPHSERVTEIIRRTVARLSIPCAPLQFAIQSSPPEHVGLGTGTQLSLTATRLILESIGEIRPSASRLAQLTGRGLRSGVGLHGFSQGGLIVDGGRGVNSAFPPLLARMDFPREWSILLVIPPIGPGLAGNQEREVFQRLPDIPGPVIDRLCRVVLLELLPAVAERELVLFGAALTELESEVARIFGPAQGGPYAHPRLAEIASIMSRHGLVGVGQSSWGPSLYGFLESDSVRQDAIEVELRRECSLEAAAIRWTTADNRGAVATSV